MEQTRLKVAAIQMISVRSWQQNLDVAEAMVMAAASEGVKLVVLPEFFIQITDANDDNRFKIAERLGNGIIQTRLAEIARKSGCYLIAGTIITYAAITDHYYNTCIVYDPEGVMVTSYNKIHLFKFDDGVNQYNEELTFSSGQEVVCCEILGFKVGLSICYDLRFPELYRQMGAIDLCVLPSAFTYVTGKAHWELLARARAVENQCYFLAVNQGGTHETGRRTYGHSMIINPWGEVLSACEEGSTIVYAELTKDAINSIRTKLPALEHRKLF